MKKKKKYSELLSVQEFAIKNKISTTEVYNRIKAGEVMSEKIGNRKFIIAK